MKHLLKILSLAGLPYFAAVGAAAAEPDIVIADFEGENYGTWQATGEAFGTGPARGTLANQMHVSGYRGERLVNSFLRGDDATGTLTSPPVKIERDYLAFLIGGGGHAGKTCLNLILDGQVVRTETGSNVAPGGREHLDLAYWNVADLKGKTVTLQIVDQATGGWGHINVDHLVLTNERPQVPEYRPLEREFTVAHRHLALPIKNGAREVELAVKVGDQVVRKYTAELATNPAEVDWYAFLTLEEFRGQVAKVSVSRGTEGAFELVRTTDQVPGSEKWYSEALRPQFHFSQAVGWNNDPNGMVYLDGEWHLYFQHNPVGWKWGNMTWGHAVSKDLVNWEQLPCALFPKSMARGDCFSGGATVDGKNTSGFKKGNHDVLVAFLTDTGAGEAMAYSHDRGRTFTWYEGNPVVKHVGRDPKVLWYAYDAKDTPLSDEARRLGGHWVMAVYDEHPRHGQNIAFYTSTDLKAWAEQSHLPGYFECPEFFELPLVGQAGETRWVVMAADARYAVGQFDGRSFRPEHEGKHQVHYGPYYASQTFDNAPGGRRIQIGWVRLDMPGMPFNQTFSFPHELTLHRANEGLRLHAQPVAEIARLHRKQHVAPAQPLETGKPAGLEVAGQLCDVRATFELGGAQKVGLDIGGNEVVYQVREARLNGAPLPSVVGRITMQVLVDRPMLEICGNHGAVFITSARTAKGEIKRVNAFAEGEGAKLVSLEVFELKSIWEK